MKTWTIWILGLVIITLLTVIFVLLLRLGASDSPQESTPIESNVTTPAETTTISQAVTTTQEVVTTTTTQPLTTTTIAAASSTTSTSETRPTTTTTTPPSTAAPSRASVSDASPGAQELFCNDVQAAIAAISLRQVGTRVVVPCHGYLSMAEELICPNLDDEDSVDAMVVFLTLWAGSELEWPEGMEPTDQEIELLMETWVESASQYLCPITN